MGVLERLEQEAREARRRRAAASGARAQREAAAQTRLAPVFEHVARYLDAFVAHLADLDRVIEASYPVADVGVLDGLRQVAYRVRRPADADGAVQLRFECTGAKPLEANVDGHPQAEAAARALREAGLTCHLRPLSARVTRLRVDATVPVRVSFAPDAERGCVSVELRNLPALGVQRYPMAPERIDRELVDAVASLVVREPSEFAALTGSVVAGGQRAELRRRLAREARQRDAELAGGLRQLAFPFSEWLRRHFLGG